MIARRSCRSVFCGNRGVARVGGCSAGARARVGESPAGTAGSAFKVRGRACPFKTTRRAQVRDFAFPLSSSSRAHYLLSEFFHIHSAAASCASSPPWTPLPRCRTGHTPTFPPSSSSVLSGGSASSSHHRHRVEGPRRRVRAPPKGFVVSFVAFHERGFSIPASRFIRGVLFEY
jgi:hypothetical protein